MTRWHPLRGRIPALRGPCSALRVATIRYGDYPSAPLRAGSEPLTYLLFPRMADERSRPPYLSPKGGNQASPVLAGDDWPRIAPSLALPRKRERGFSWGDDLFDHYRYALKELGKQKGLLGLIFNKWHGGIRS